jgi:hypothetical protein
MPRRKRAGSHFRRLPCRSNAEHKSPACLCPVVLPFAGFLRSGAMEPRHERRSSSSDRGADGSAFTGYRYPRLCLYSAWRAEAVRHCSRQPDYSSRFRLRSQRQLPSSLEPCPLPPARNSQCLEMRRVVKTKGHSSEQRPSQRSKPPLRPKQQVSSWSRPGRLRSAHGYTWCVIATELPEPGFQRRQPGTSRVLCRSNVSCPQPPARFLLSLSED